MQHIITDEEAERALQIYFRGNKGCFETMKAALTDFLNNRPQVAQLRPIAEMSEKPPEGFIRIGVLFKANQEIDAVLQIFPGKPTHKSWTVIDVFPPSAPDPDAEDRRQFEEWAKPKNWNLSFNDGRYVLAWVHNAFQAYKEGKTSKASK